MVKPDYSNIVKLAPVSEIIPGLWQGGAPETYIGYQMVVSCERYVRKTPASGWDGLFIHVPMEDEDNYPIPEILVADVAENVARAIKEKWKVLIHCTGGLNRSSVVTVETLVNLGWPRDKAVTQLRLARDVMCLCNRSFERYALREPSTRLLAEQFGEVAFPPSLPDRS